VCVCLCERERDREKYTLLRVCRENNIRIFHVYYIALGEYLVCVTTEISRGGLRKRYCTLSSYITNLVSFTVKK